MFCWPQEQAEAAGEMQSGWQGTGTLSTPVGCRLPWRGGICIVLSSHQGISLQSRLYFSPIMPTEQAECCHCCKHQERITHTRSLILEKIAIRHSGIHQEILSTAPSFTFLHARFLQWCGSCSLTDL